MPYHNSKTLENKEPEKTSSASPEQIITLYGLTREVSQLAHQVNYPLNSIILAGMTSVIQCVGGARNKSVIGDENFSAIPAEGIFMVGRFLESCLIAVEPKALRGSTFNNLLIASTIIVGFYVLCYKIWQATSALMFHLFPNGLGSHNKKYTTAIIQQNLISETKTKELIIELRKLIAKQRAQKNMGILIGCIFCIVLPILIYKRVFFALNVDAFGPTICVGDDTKESVPSLLYFPQQVFNVTQRAALYNHIYNRWLNYNTPKQLKKYQQRLEMLNYSNQEWIIKSGNSKSSVIYELDLSSATACIDKLFDENKITQKLSLEKFIFELHCIFIQKNIPNFISDNNKIYIGYAEISDKEMRSIKIAFEEKLHKAAEQEKIQEFILRELNKISKTIKTDSLLQWDFYHSLGENGRLEKYYYCNIKPLPSCIRKLYIKALYLITHDMTVDENIITLAKVPTDPTFYNNAITKFLEGIQPFNSNLITNKSANKKNKQKNKLETTESKNEESLSPKEKSPKKVLPEEDDVQFSYSVRIPSHSAEEKLDVQHTAFQLHVPWISEGHAWGSIDGEIFDAVQEYLSSARIISRLEIGEVHGTSQSNKTKVGAVGIQTTDEDYTTIHGEKVDYSTFKIKDSNIRIFARKLETAHGTSGERYTHYRFDGWDFGH